MVRQTVLPFKLERTDETLTAHGGLALLAEFIDGADATAACGNHMNPPLSYASPSQLAHTEVMAGLAPVSSGGDNIAGVIDAQSRAPRFADAAGEWISSGSLSLTSRSVDNSLTEDVQAALANVKTLKGLLPICAWCNKVRDEDGDWHPMEVYIKIHSDASFSHGICPECRGKVGGRT